MQKLGHEINFVTFLDLIIMNLQFPLLVYAFFLETYSGTQEVSCFWYLLPINFGTHS